MQLIQCTFLYIGSNCSATLGVNTPTFLCISDNWDVWDKNEVIDRRLPIFIGPCNELWFNGKIKHLARWYYESWTRFLARWLTSARAYRIGGRKVCPSVCLYVKRYLLLQFCTDYNQTWINMIWAVAAKTLLSQIFHKWRKIEVNCVYISRCAQLVSYFWNAGMHTK